MQPLASAGTAVTANASAAAAPLQVPEALAGEPGAAPLLAEHILDPADSDDDVREAAAALASLATASEAPALEQFFAMYRATAANDDLAAAVASVARALVRLDPKKGRARVEFALKDSQTSAAVVPLRPYFLLISELKTLRAARTTSNGLISQPSSAK